MAKAKTPLPNSAYFTLLTCGQLQVSLSMPPIKSRIVEYRVRINGRNYLPEKMANPSCTVPKASRFSSSLSDTSSLHITVESVVLVRYDP
jgi:hypothetical protein